MKKQAVMGDVANSFENNGGANNDVSLLNLKLTQ